MYTLRQIAAITGARLEGSIDYPVVSFLTDSRDVIDQEHIMFVAIKTQKNNGHNYIKDLISKGVTAFLVQDGEVDLHQYDINKVSFLICDNPLLALQALAAHHRVQFDIPVIGITGSNGKTMVKEWLYQLLKSDYSICRSPKSFNSQLGVPLSVLGLRQTHILAIFEAGVSQPGEMDVLQHIIKPTIGIITSIGSAHDEGFSNREQKVKEKLKLVQHCDWIIVNGLDEKSISQEIRSKTLLISNEGKGDVNYKFENGILNIRSGNIRLNLEVAFQDEASISNIATCVAALLKLNVPLAEIEKRVAALQPVALRLEIKNGIHNSLLINDYYNSDLDSLKIALSFLNQQNRRLYKCVIISDIEQSGIANDKLYRDIAALVSSNKIDLLVGIGKRISSFKTNFKRDSLFFESTEDFIHHFKIIEQRFSHSTILLKGARSFGFEAIGNLLQQKSHDTTLEIDLNKLTANVNYFRSLLKPATKLMCMVKAMGYGGGGSELAKTLQHIGVNYLAVAYADEGVELRQSQVNLPVMVMSPESGAFEDIINYRLEPEIFSFKSLRDFIEKLDKLGISEPYPVHIKIDTGMHRLGFMEHEIDQLIAEIKNKNQVKVQSVFSHLAASDNPALDSFTKQQLSKFKQACDKFQNELSYSFLKHISNSAGISRFPDAHFDMVRLGIGMHGIGVDDAQQKHLQNVSTLKTIITQIKEVKAGETVGYNRNGPVEKDTTIAIIPIGYADGFSRMLGNGRFGVYVNGKFCKTIGNVCMDMCMIDVTDLKCREQDTVIIFENIEQLNAMANSMHTITYEVLTSVSGRVKRVYIQE
jgi:alanine racemase